MNSARLAILTGGIAILILVVAAVLAHELRRGQQAADARRQAEVEAELRREREADRKEAAVAFADPQPPSPNEQAEFGKVLDRLGVAAGRGNAAEVVASFDLERFTDELDRRGVLARIPGGIDRRNRSAFIAGMREGLGRALTQNEAFQWDRSEIRRVRWSADRSEAVVLAIHRVAALDDAPAKIRWWLVRRAGGWKVYDIEDLDLGLRITEVISLSVDPDFVTELQKDPTRLHTATTAIREATVAIAVRKDVDAADRALAPTRHVRLPVPLQALRELVEGRILLERGDSDGSLKRIDEADRLQPGMPVSARLRAAALVAGGRPDEALPLIRQYLAELGGDGDAHLIEALALEGLNRPAEAAEAYGKSLDDQPAVTIALEGLRRVLPDDKKAELGTRLAKFPDPAKAFDELVRTAREEKDEAAIAGYEAGLRQARPQDPRGITAYLRRQVAKGAFQDAAAEVRTKLADRRIADEDRTQILNTYLFAMLQAGREAEGYAAVPDGHAANAFRLLVEELEDDLFDGEPEQAKAAKRIRTLIAAHRKRAPKDPWAGYYEGVLLQTAKEYDEAEQAFAAAQALYLKTTRPAPKEKDEADRFRSHRVACLYALKEGLKAHAEIGPRADTFRQLANSYERDKDMVGLERLLAAHRKADPRDPVLSFWAARVLYLQEEYSEAADGFRTYLKVAGESDPERSRATDGCVRGYLRAEQLADARRAVAEFGPERVSAGLRAAVALADGRPADAEAILAGLTEKNPGGHNFLYYDEDFARLISQPAFAALRKKYPDPRPAKTGPKG